MLAAFDGIAASFERSRRDWSNWILSAIPEQECLPGEWDGKLKELQGIRPLKKSNGIQTQDVARCSVARAFVTRGKGMPLIRNLSKRPP